MPYVITTTRPVGLHHGRPTAREHAERIGGRFDLGPQGFVVASVTRRAVVTLDEARAVCRAVDPDDNGDVRGPLTRMVDALTDSGGTVGPLPDGTTIRVALVRYEDLLQLGGPIYPTTTTHAEILAAYNAAQETRA